MKIKATNLLSRAEYEFHTLSTASFKVAELLVGVEPRHAEAESIGIMRPVPGTYVLSFALRGLPQVYLVQVQID